MRAMPSIRFPGESDEYRRARDELLNAEIELRRHVEQVAALRRTLPSGGRVPEDYVFEEGGPSLDDRSTVRTVRLSQLFDPGKKTLVVYSFMYGPRMADACPMCTSFLDALDGNAYHLRQRVSLAVVARSPIERIREHARSRGWGHLRLLSSAKSSYHPDYHGEAADGSQLPMMNVFTKSDGEVRHFYASEALFAGSEAGQHPRHIDLLWPLWNVLDLTPEGRGTDWRPKLVRLTTTDARLDY